MNLSLRNARLSAAFAHRGNLGSRMGQRQYLLRDQIVGKNHVRSLEKPQNAKRKQIGISRPRSRKVDRAGFSSGVHDFFSGSGFVGNGFVRAC